MVFGLDEFGMTGEEYVELYLYKLTPSERKYYDMWSKWKRFQISPSQFLNTKTLTRDMIKALEDIDSMYHERTKIKESKDQMDKAQMQFRPMQQTTRANKTKSVL